MAGESLHRLGCEAGFDPARDGKVSEPMPIEAIDTFNFVEQRQELPLDHVVVPDISAAPVWED
jgi:hypothetical protein